MVYKLWKFGTCKQYRHSISDFASHNRDIVGGQTPLYEDSIIEIETVSHFIYDDGPNINQPPSLSSLGIFPDYSSQTARSKVGRYSFCYSDRHPDEKM